MGDRLFFLIMRGRVLAQARPVLVSEDEDFVRDAVAFAGDRLNVEVEKVLGSPLPGPKLVTDIRGHGRYDATEYDHERTLELVRVEDGLPGTRLVASRHPKLLDTAFELVKNDPEPGGAGIDRRVAMLRLSAATSASYGNLRDAGGTSNPEVLARFIQAYCDSDEATDGERAVLQSLLPDLAEQAEREAADREAHDQWDSARRQEEAAHSGVRFAKRDRDELRRQAVAARNRLEAAERTTLRPGEKRMHELREQAEEAERQAADAEEGLVEAEKAHQKASVESSRALKAWTARKELSDEHRQARSRD